MTIDETDKPELESSENTTEQAPDAAASELTATAVPETALKQPRRHKKKTKRRSGKVNQAVKEVTQWFAACARCSYFLAGYHAIVGKEGLETTIMDSGDKWLTIDWDNRLRELIQKSYGGRMDIDYYQVDGTCMECKRHYIYRGEDDVAAAEFRIEMKPQPRKF